MKELSLEELIVSIVEPLVDFPEDIHVSSLEKDEQVIYTLSVNAEDTGKVIGKQGRTAKAIRTVMFAAGAESSKKVQLEIAD
ncbi:MULTISPECIES: KH domain-containing protein [Bacillus]|uniref:RNA-binding protein KhpA n=1 Tax=Bacillus xiamenensis TaxID=1178537 RepID=A0ABT4EYE0_9BACI|nr:MULTISPECIES: KH domain-containing protein [Bacillus]MBG9912621.1 RNA-binding protein [Bacillus xiamenensis]MCW1835644.1 KH domain-containing protein [Bacillus xiamenensis]MCY9574820.1 KH domain-containing protein [Bacillus xiamenensis]QGX66093.1 KH domain-containing protein [Bacillus sp. ms-22]